MDVRGSSCPFHDQPVAVAEGGALPCGCLGAHDAGQDRGRPDLDARVSRHLDGLDVIRERRSGGLIRRADAVGPGVEDEVLRCGGDRTGDMAVVDELPDRQAAVPEGVLPYVRAWQDCEALPQEHGRARPEPPGRLEFLK